MAASKTVGLPDVLQRSVHAHALGGRARGVSEAVGRAACVYGSAPMCSFSLAVRVRGYTPEMLNRAVLVDRELVRVPAMRGAIYLVPTKLMWHALTLTKLRPVEYYAKLAGIPKRSYAPLTDRIEEVLSGAALTTSEIRTKLGRKAPKGNGLGAILRRMTHEGRILRTRVRGGVRSQSYEYGRVEEWVDVPEERPSRSEALRDLARLWMQANGPATAADLAWWAGVGIREATTALSAIGAGPIMVKGIAGDLLATQEQVGKLRLSPGKEDSVHLLPCWDSFTMAHRDRSRYLEDSHRPFVVDRVGNVTNVVLHGGRVAGIWDFDEGVLLYATFKQLPGRAIVAAAAKLASVQGISKARKVDDPLPLSAGSKNAFLAPLRPGGPGRAGEE